MTDPGATLRVERVGASALYDLRRRVLRAGRPEAVVANRADEDPLARHFAGYLDGRLVVSASFFAEDGIFDAGARQLRYMATDFDVQGRGLGAALLAGAEDVLAREGVRTLWANARDSALGFYRRCGWRVVEGSEHISEETQIPHTVIVKDIGAARG